MTSTTSQAPDRFDQRLLPPMMLGSILNPINSSIIAVALVPIATAFGAPASQAAWLISALYVSTSIGQPLIGRLVDTFGPRALFLVGAALTGIAGVIGVVAPSIGVLIAARVILGFGTCAGYPAAMYLIRSEAKRTGIASPAGVLTALSVTTQTIAVIGPTLGGLLIGLGGWRATFAINIPLAIGCLLLGWFSLPKHALLDDDVEPKPLRLDFLGIALFAATLISLLLFLMDVHLELLWLLPITAACAVGFTLRELRYADPFIDIRVFAGNVPLLVTYARGVAAATVSYCFLYGVTQWLEAGRGLSASQAGLLLLPTFITGIVMAVLVGRRPQVRGKLIAGAIAQLVACTLLLFTHTDSAIWFLLAIAIIFGIPQGLLSLAIQNTLYHQADPSRMGASAGLLRTFMYLGAMIASSASSAFYGNRATTGGLHELAVFMIVAAGTLLVITATDRTLDHLVKEATAHTRQA